MVIELPRKADSRGSLTYIQRDAQVPFDIERVFYIYDVPHGAVRGEHAHEREEQLVVAVDGAVDVTVRTGPNAKPTKHRLETPNRGLYVPPRTWTVLDEFAEGAVVLVLSSEPHDPDEYVRDLEALG
jgi:dTDP-4-dehydrorhamnose 3,5-epimerase-like enzyme